MAESVKQSIDIPHPINLVHQAMTQRNVIEGVIVNAAPEGSELVKHESDGGTTSYEAKVIVPQDALPFMARGFFDGDLTIVLTQSWKLVEGKATGKLTATIEGEGNAEADTTLVEKDGATTWSVNGSVKARESMISGKVESEICEKLAELAEMEAAYITRVIENDQRDK